MRLRRLIVAAPLVFLSACAGATPPSRASAAGLEIGEISSPYGMFLAGKAALNDGKSGEAARYLNQARAQSKGDPAVAEEAFTAALLAGDIDQAAALSASLVDSSEGAKRLSALVVAVDALATGKAKQAQDLLSGERIAFPHKSAAAMLSPWAAAAAGDVETALVRPQVRGDRIVDYFGQLGQAFLYERFNRFDEAETDFKAVAGTSSPSEIAVLDYGGFLERRGRRVDALALYEKYLGQEPSAAGVKLAKARAAAAKPAPPAPTVAQGAASALLASSATMISAKQTQNALAYLRMALRLDPQRDEAWVMVGDIMASRGDIDAARQAYGRPKAGSSEFTAAQAKLAWTYQTENDTPTALRLARAAAATGDADARLTLADLLRANDQHAEAVVILSGLIADAKAPDWRLLYGRGASYERLGRWTEAQADLHAALKSQPDEPELLNYLGYSMIDRGERLSEALAMVQKAVAANPQSGAMTDSLGWAYFRLGDFKKAVESLELAVELEAGDPDINDHLGDAYWRVGRLDEARFQWNRVLTLKPEPKTRASAEAKLAGGLPPVVGVARVADR